MQAVHRKRRRSEFEDREFELEWESVRHPLSVLELFDVNAVSGSRLKEATLRRLLSPIVHTDETESSCLVDLRTSFCANTEASSSFDRSEAVASTLCRFDDSPSVNERTRLALGRAPWNTRKERPLT